MQDFVDTVPTAPGALYVPKPRPQETTASGVLVGVMVGLALWVLAAAIAAALL
jgi:hypothetical protein